MENYSFVFRLILIFLPGIVAFIIIDNLTIHRETKTHHWFFYPLLLGFICYAPWYLLVSSVQSVYGVNLPFQFVTSITDMKAHINFSEIIIASFTAIILGFLITWAMTNRFLFRLANFLNISDKFPEIDAWDNFVALYNPDWLTVRDLDNGLVYQGAFVSASDANDRDGIVLQDVRVYNEECEFQYWAPAIYISRKMDRLLIEMPNPCSANSGPSAKETDTTEPS